MEEKKGLNPKVIDFDKVGLLKSNSKAKWSKSII